MKKIENYREFSGQCKICNKIFKYNYTLSWFRVLNRIMQLKFQYKIKKHFKEMHPDSTIATNKCKYAKILLYLQDGFIDLTRVIFLPICFTISILAFVFEWLDDRFGVL